MKNVEEFYKVISENLDNTKMNKEKEKYNEYLNLYKNVIINLYITVNTLKELTTNLDTICLLKTSPAFYYSVIKNFWLTSIINICSFFSSDNMSFYKFLNYIKGNHDKIFTGKFRERIVNRDGKCKDRLKDIKFSNTILSIVAECEIIIEQNIIIIDDIKILRKKVFAHFNGNQSDYKDLLKRVKIDDLLKVIKIIETLYNKINIRYDRVYTSLEPTNSIDIRNTLSTLKTAQDYKKELFDLKYRKTI